MNQIQYNDEKIKLSIVVPIYNSQEHLEECIQSIISQSFKEFELILVDDGSSDNSKKICSNFVKIDERVKYFYQENSGVSSARNNGINISKGESIMFIDSDDVLPQGALNELMSFSMYSFVMGGYSEFLNSPLEKSENIYCKPFEGKVEDFFWNISNYISPPLLLGPCFKLFKKSIIKNNNILFPPNLSYGEDAMFVIEYLKYVTDVKCVNKNLYLYRKSNLMSLSSKFREDKIDINISIASMIRDLLNYNNVDGDFVFSNCVVRFFDDYMNELFLYKLPYRLSKKIFYDKVDEYNLCNFYDSSLRLSLKNKIRYYVMKKKYRFLLLYIVYQLNFIKNKLIKGGYYI